MASAGMNQDETTEFVRGLGLLDCIMMVAGAMIGSGIFLVSAQIARQVGAPGWLLVVWIITGLLTLMGALTYGELAAMMPKAGGQYVYLREAFSPLWGFLYGWTFFLVIQAGTIAAVAIGFARYLGDLVPYISESKNYIIEPIQLGSSYAISLSWAQAVGICLILFLTFINIFGLQLGKWIQNIFTVAKLGALLALIVLGLTVGYNATAAGANLGDLWTIRSGLEKVSSWTDLTAISGLGLFVGICVAQTLSLFSADAWNNVTFIAGEIKNPRRTLPLALAIGTTLVIGLYLAANLAYLVSLSFAEIQSAPSDRVASLTANAVFGDAGKTIMAIAIMISTFGCNNGLTIAGSRMYYAMARDGLFFSIVARLNRFKVPAWGLILQGIWACVLVLPRVVVRDAETGAIVRDPETGITKYGNLYGNLLDYVMSAALIFYILTIAGVFVLRVKRPDAVRPYRAFGYPIIPLLYIISASVILTVLFIYQPATTWPGLIIAASGIPVYFFWNRGNSGVPR